MKEEELRQYFSMNDSDLYLELGKKYSDDIKSSQFGPLGPKDLIELGKKYVAASFKKAKDQLCQNEMLKAYVVNNDRIDDVHLAVAIGEILAHNEWVFKAHVAIISVAIAKKGLNKLCE